MYFDHKRSERVLTSLEQAAVREELRDRAERSSELETRLEEIQAKESTLRSNNKVSLPFIHMIGILFDLESIIRSCATNYESYNLESYSPRSNATLELASFPPLPAPTLFQVQVVPLCLQLLPNWGENQDQNQFRPSAEFL